MIKRHAGADTHPRVFISERGPASVILAGKKMKRKCLKAAAAFLAAVILITITASSSSAAVFSDLDLKTADAGASLALSGYFASHEDAAEKISAALSPIIAIAEEQTRVTGQYFAENSEEITYETRVIGKVCTEGTLNVREATSTLSDIVARVVRKMEVWVVGEKLVNGHLWYRIELDDVSGYVSANYIRFGDDAERYFAEAREAFKEQAQLPASFELPEEYQSLDQGTRDSLEYYAQQINYCLTNDYAAQEANQNFINMYSVLIYLLENYQAILDVANEYGLSETIYQVNQDITLVEFMREKLSDMTGQTEQDFYNEISAVIESSIEASKAADAAYQAQLRASTGHRIADYAASFVGRLPYVWGGASLTYGADCSGFCGQIYAAFGLLDQGAANAHAYNSTSMRTIGYGVDISQIQPGDLICYPGHVAIYFGNGVAVHEPSPGHYASYGNLYMLPIVTIRRLY